MTDAIAEIRARAGKYEGGVLASEDIYALFLHIEKVEARLAEVERQRDEAREALKPFADFTDRSGAFPDNQQITMGSGLAQRQLTMGDCRRAAAIVGGGG